MVAVGGNPGRKRTTDDLGIVELLASRIGAGDKDPADGVTGTMPEPSLARLEETRVLMEHGGQNRAGKIVLDRAIREVRRKALAVADRSLTIARFAVFGLAHPGQKTVPGDLDVVE